MIAKMEANQDKRSGATPAVPKNGRGRVVAVVILTLALAALSVVSRIHFIQTRPLAGRLDGQEPESHILVTDLAFGQTPWKIHHFLPLFTYGAPYDKDIDQHPGAASPDRFGNYYYCSTPPLTFVLPYLAAQLTGAGPGITSIRWYNLSLQILAALALAGLVFLCARCEGMETEAGLLVSAAALVIYMTAPECLKSHAINLWAQQFYAVLLMIEMICFLFYPSAILLFLFAWIGCLEDWTPYIANAGMAVIALFSYAKTRNVRALRLAFALLLGCLLAGLTMIGWFSTVMTVHDYFQNLALRMADRAGYLSLQAELPLYYLNSFGVYVFAGLAVLFLRPWRFRRSVAEKRPRVILPGADPLVVALGIVAIALLENLLMCGHATAYSYDRLKGVQFLALFVAWGMLRRRDAALWVFGLCLAAGLFSIYFFWRTYDTSRGWAYMAHSQQERIGAIIAKTASTNGPAFFNGEVRGAEVYYARRNLYQLRQVRDAAAFAEQWCRIHHFAEGTVYEISGDYPVPADSQLPRSIHIRRIHASGTVDDLGSVRVPEKPGDYHPPSRWGQPFGNGSGLTPSQMLQMWLWQ